MSLTTKEQIHIMSKSINKLLSNKANKDHNHDSVYETKTDAANKLVKAKAYTDTKVAEAMQEGKYIENQNYEDQVSNGFGLINEAETHKIQNNFYDDKGAIIAIADANEDQTVKVGVYNTNPEIQIGKNSLGLRILVGVEKNRPNLGIYNDKNNTVAQSTLSGGLAQNVVANKSSGNYSRIQAEVDKSIVRANTASSKSELLATTNASTLTLSQGASKSIVANVTADTAAIAGLDDPTADNQAANKRYVDTSIANLVDSAPEELNTLNELAAAMKENFDVVDALNAAITNKADKTEIPTKISELENDAGYLTEAPEQVQADWNQNDENAIDYVKNRPFYSNLTITEILDVLKYDGEWIEEYGEVKWSPTNPDNMPVIDPVFVVGGTYTLIVNGVEYECVAQSEDGMILLCDDASMTNYNVYAVFMPGETAGLDAYAGKLIVYVAGVKSNLAPVTEFRIVGMTREIVKIDEIYLPDSVIDGINTAQITAADAQTTADNAIGKAETNASNLATEITNRETADNLKMDKNNPVGIGSFSMNRKADTVIGNFSHAEGNKTTASGHFSHAEGNKTTASGYSSHAEGNETTASGHSSHAEGFRTTASGNYSHIEGYGYGFERVVKLTGDANSTTYIINSTDHDIELGRVLHKNNTFAKIISYNHSTSTIITDKTLDSTNALNKTYVTLCIGVASGNYSHAEGFATTGSGEASHAEGYWTVASGKNSHAEGNYTVASGDNQHVQGKYNINDVDSNANALKTYAHIVGNGESDDARSNAHTLDWEGNAWFSGDVYVGSTSGKNKDEGSKKLVTEDEIATLKTQVTATSLILADAITGQKYEIQIQNGQLISSPVEE